MSKSRKPDDFLHVAPPGPSEIAAICDRIDKPVVLIGLMGVGKSTVGKRLASLMERSFSDADAEIEEASQMAISEMFAEFGEAYFRDGERRVIARLMEEQPGVIATGGGAFMQAETRKLILERGIAVWLDCDIRTLVERTARRDTRPLLKDGDPETILRKLYDDRAPIYAEAPVHVRTSDAPHAKTALNILEAIDRWL